MFEISFRLAQSNLSGSHQLKQPDNAASSHEKTPLGRARENLRQRTRAGEHRLEFDCM